jgi:hypothetical protein
LKDKEGNILKMFNLMIPLITTFGMGSDTVQYQVILGDYENIANLVPKKEYSLVIVDIPHGYNIQNIGYDYEPYTYQAFNKVVTRFVNVTMSPLWRFVVFIQTHK